MNTPSAPPDLGLIEVIDALSQNTDFSDLAHLLTTSCVSALKADAAGVMLKDQVGGLHVIGASDEDTHSLELFEIQSKEGPCYESAMGGHLVLEEEVAGASTWPAFRDEALSLGYQSTVAVPLRANEQLLGALNLFWKTPQSFTDQTIRFARAFADLAAMGLLLQDRATDAQELALRLEGATQTRIMIEQAKGMLAVQGNLTMNDSFALMSKFGRRTSQTLRSISLQVINRSIRVKDMLGEPD